MSGKAAKAATAKVDLDATRERLEKVGLSRAKERLDELLAGAVKESPPARICSSTGFWTKSWSGAKNAASESR